MGQDYYGKIRMLDTYVEKGLAEIGIFDEQRAKAIATADSAIGGPKT